MQVLECEVRLHNACGLDSGPQDILLSRDVGGLGYPVQIVQVAEKEEEEGETKTAEREGEEGRRRETSWRKCVRSIKVTTVRFGDKAGPYFRHLKRK